MLKYLTFMLGEETFGLEILSVREIIGLMEITKVPKMPGFVRGVINLRGRVIPVVDLRLKFEMDAAVETEETCIIVVMLDDLVTGLLVDRVSEVLDIDFWQTEEVPRFGAGIDTAFIKRMGKARGRVIMLLDIPMVLTASDMDALKPSAQESRAGEELFGN